MPNSKEIPWIRIAAEGGAIVISILLAFWIEAWWSDRQSDRDERDYLSTLEIVLIDYRSNFEGNMQYISSIRNSNRMLLDAAVNPDVRLSDDELDQLISSLTWYLPADNSPELEFLLSSEDIALVSNSQLRYKLGALHAELASLQAAVTLQLDFFLDQLSPYLQKNVNLPQISHFVEDMPGSPDEQYVGHQPTLGATESHQEILNDREFQNILMQWEWHLTSVFEWRNTGSDDIDGEIDMILHILRNEIANEF
jgi:hypothetical protein